MTANKLFYLTTCLALISFKGRAQLNANVLGSAEILDNNCFLITPAVNNQSGGVWYDNSIDFSNDFTIYYQSYFGSNDANGADGMALVFKRTSNPVIGVSGGGVVEREFSPKVFHQNQLTLSLKNKDITTNSRIVDEINRSFKGFYAKSIDPSSLKVELPESFLFEKKELGRSLPFSESATRL